MRANERGPIEYWAPADWRLAHFPLAGPCEELLDLIDMTDRLLEHLDYANAADTSPVCSSLHCAHMLKILQGNDGLWPSKLSARTGETCGEDRTDAPVRFLVRLTGLLNTTEFDGAIARQKCALAER